MNGEPTSFWLSGLFFPQVCAVRDCVCYMCVFMLCGHLLVLPFLKGVQTCVQNHSYAHSHSHKLNTHTHTHFHKLNTHPTPLAPQGFMTAVLQNHARKTGVPIDRFTFSFKVRHLTIVYDYRLF